MVFRPTYPRQAFDQLREEVNRLFSSLTDGINGPWSPTGRGQVPVNVWEQPDAIQVELEVPGVKADQVEISVAENDLTIQIQRPDTAQEGTVFHRRERPSGSFQRVVALPAPVDADRVTAQLRDGVLTVTLPKIESARPRKINVTSG